VMSAHGQVLAPWPMAGQNAQRTGEALAIGPLTQPTAKWTVVQPDYPGFNVVVGPTAVFFVDSDSGITACNFNGTPKWIFTPYVSGSFAIGPDGTLYVAGHSDYSIALYAIDPEGEVLEDGTLGTGAIKWCIPSTVIGSFGTLLIDDAGCIFANGYKIQDNDSGYQLLWDGRRLPAALAVYKATSGDIIYGGDTYHLYAFKSSDGSTLWTRTFKSYVRDPAVGSDGTVYLTTDDFTLWAINPATGAIKWQAAVGKKVNNPWGPHCDAVPAIDNDAGIVYCAGKDSFYAFNKNTGQLKWKKSFPPTNAGAGGKKPAIGIDGTVYWSDPFSVLFAMSAANGATLWFIDVSGAGGARSEPVIDLDGTIYIVTGNGLTAYQD
jgi:outer membrane protein assembly factor BamB